MAYVEARVRQWMSTRQAILSSRSGGRETPGDRAAKATAKQGMHGVQGESQADADADTEKVEEEQEEKEDEDGTDEDNEDDDDTREQQAVAGPSSSAAASTTKPEVINLMVVQHRALVAVNGPDRKTKLLWLLEVLYNNKRRLSKTTPRIDMNHAVQVFSSPSPI